MENTLIQDNFDELIKLSKEDREIVMTYFNNWTETSPAYFDDNDTLQEKIENTFTKWFNEHHDMENFTAEDVIETLYDCFQETASYLEYSVDAIVSYYNGVYDEKYFEEILSNYFVVSE
jgi:hypothetical protein